MKEPTTGQKKTRNKLQQADFEMTCNDLQRAKSHLHRPKTTNNEQKKNT